MTPIEEKMPIIIFWPVLIWSITLVLVERWIPIVWGVAGVIAGIWVYPPQVAYAMAFFAGIIFDLTWGKPLGITSLGLVVMTLVFRLIHDQLTQWWVVGVLAIIMGLITSWWLWGSLSWWLILLAPGLTYMWWYIMLKGLPEGKGIYLQRS